MKALAIIPARYASSRFPGKPLAGIGDTPMLQMVYKKVMATGLFGNVIIATDDDRIYKAASAWDANVVMTSADHTSGTERCAEVVNMQDTLYDVVINIQGDEPFISSEPLQQLINLFSNKDVEIGTLVQKITDGDELHSYNLVKVVLNAKWQAMYFSRYAIPYVREASNHNLVTHWKHIGIYGYRMEILQKLVGLQDSMLEKAESLEQLRWLEQGYKIFTAETNYRMIAVDTPEDLKKAEEFYLSTLSE